MSVLSVLGFFVMSASICDLPKAMLALGAMMLVSVPISTEDGVADD